MAGEQQAWRVPERMLRRQRLFATDIDHRARQLAFFQRRDQIGIDHRHSSPGIDEQGAGLQLGEQRGIVQIAGRRGIRQQIDQVVRLCRLPGKLRQPGDFPERLERARLTGDAVQLDAERLEEARNTLADVAAADDQDPTPCQTMRQAVVPAPLDLAGQTRQQLPLMGQDVGQDILRHHLAEDSHRPAQAIVPRQLGRQHRRDPGPGGLQPRRLQPLPQQGHQQVRTAQPDRTVPGQPGQLLEIGAAAKHQIRRGSRQ